MHWSEEIAEKIVAKNPNKEVYTCAAGISPSGSIHIGNFRDVATSLMVVMALKKMGKNAKLLFSFDNFDRLRKVPVNVAAVTENFEENIGRPYVDVPNPFDTEESSYAEHFENEFVESMKEFGIELDYRRQAQMYRSGVYAKHIITALDKRTEIFDILDSFRTQDAQEGEREAYYPVEIYCSECKRDTTKIISYNDETKVAEYECKCGCHGTFDFNKDTNCKLGWKIDWPMRWMYEQVDFEPGGKDHAAPGGSYDTSSVIARKIFGIEPPMFQGYEFIGIKGTTGKMSSSSGLNLTPGTLLKIYQPEILLWLYSKSAPNKAFDLCLDDGILRHYFEFDKQYDQYINGTADDYTRAIMDMCILDKSKKIKLVPMSLIVQLGSIVDFNVPMMETVFEKIGQPFKYEDFEERLNRAKFWLENCSPENANRLLAYRNWEVYETLDADLKKEIELLCDYLKNNEYTLDELNTKLYDIPKVVFGADNPDLKKLQGAFFTTVYKLLIGKERGPRLYLFLYAIDKNSYVRLLDFAEPKTEEEAKAEEEARKAAEEAANPTKKVVEYGDPDPVSPIKEEISLDDFKKVDLRVCKIIKCQEIRKSHNCYKLTLDDGIKERVIVSSIKDYYTAEELVGKKIIVVANLAPTRITGVTSEGMLVAATNTACACQVVFVDDIVPVGTPIM